jgi:CxC5 like cysteine cluster associated with KDZ transposases
MGSNTLFTAAGMTIYPAQHCCINPVCERAMRQFPLKKEQQRCAVVFTVADGACLVLSQLACNFFSTFLF